MIHSFFYDSLSLCVCVWHDTLCNVLLYQKLENVCMERERESMSHNALLCVCVCVCVSVTQGVVLSVFILPAVVIAARIFPRYTKKR
mmetsp:Transcript_27047/g.40175  ORF Transcript_27047/g.40175 Transcript_27047/m.40175 type:complete len:87 (+) Transcript_27047:2334-2594(+)